MTRSTFAIPLVALALLAAGCGSDAGNPVADPTPTETGWTNYVPLGQSKLLAGMTPHARKLDHAALADDALDRERLALLLDRSGFIGGAENEYTGRPKIFSHVVVRELLFKGAAGADAYLSWLREHTSDLIGEVRWRKPLALGANGSLFLDAGCGCHSDLPTYLGAWRRGANIVTVLADGPGVGRKRFQALAAEQDRMLLLE